MQLLPQLLPLPDSWPGPLKERLRVLHSELHERIQREETSRVGIPGDTAKDIKGHRKVTEVTEERLWRCVFLSQDCHEVGAVIGRQRESARERENL